MAVVVGEDLVVAQPRDGPSFGFVGLQQCRCRLAREHGGEFPPLAKVIRDATHPDTDTTFDIGLDCVLDGIATRLGERRR